MASAQDTTDEQLWGSETAKAVENFPVSGAADARCRHPLARPHQGSSRARQRASSASSTAISPSGSLQPADAVAAGEHDDQFPIDVFQTGSGTSSHTNVNEVIASLAGEGVHPNDHVNRGQSSNDVFPSAVHLAALDEVTNDLLPALDGLAAALGRKAEEFDDVVKSGRTHLMDAVPVTLGQEFGGYAAQVRSSAPSGCAARSAGSGQIPLGGTATGTGLNTHREFAEKVGAGSPRTAGLRSQRPTTRSRRRRAATPWSSSPGRSRWSPSR